MTLSPRGYGALERRLLAILNAEDQVFETYTLVADAFDVKAGEDGLRMISTAQMSAARRALRGLVRDGAVIDLGRHYPNTRRYWCGERTELLHEIRYKREVIEAPDTPRSGRQGRAPQPADAPTV